MKYCLISFTNINVLPYANKYIDEILKNGNECDLMFWDKTALNGVVESKLKCKTFCYNKTITPSSGYLDKIIGYFGATIYFNLLLLVRRYDRLVFLETHSAVVNIVPILLKYTKKYIIEIRDFTFERFCLYRFIEKAIIKRAKENVISSVGYKVFLPKGKYIICHNITRYNEAEISEIIKTTQHRKPYLIAFVGSVRFIEINKLILNKLKNDKRFIVGYFGVGSAVLEDFCKKNNINNTVFKKGFLQEETLLQYKGVSAINNIYGNNDPRLDYALSNKLYHAAQLQIPILVSSNTYMADVSCANNFGYVVNLDDPLMAEKLYQWLENIDRDKLTKGTKKFLTNVNIESKEYNLMIHNFSKGK